MREFMLILHFVGVALSLGTVFAFLIIRKTCSKITVSESEQLLRNAKKLVIFSHIGLGILFISGGYLMTPYWKVLTTMPLLPIKFTVYAIWLYTLILMSFHIRKSVRNYNTLCNPTIGFLSLVSLIFGLLAVCLAVIQFH